MNKFISLKESIDDKINRYQTYLAVNETAKIKLVKYKKQLDLFHENELEKITTKEQGDLLEDFFECLFRNINVLEYKRNIRTGSNEVDIIIKLTMEGRILRKEEIIPKWFPDTMHIECKNYRATVGVTYINKFYSIVRCSASSIGSFISYKGLAGKNKSGWQDAHGLIYKYGLMHLANNEKEPLILNITGDNITRLVERDYSFFEWIEEIRIKILSDMKVDFELSKN